MVGAGEDSLLARRVVRKRLAHNSLQMEEHLNQPSKDESNDQPPLEGHSHIQRNIRSVARMDQQTLDDRSYSDRLADWVNRQASRMSFIVMHIIWFTSWMWFNRGGAAVKPFDPYPFPLLSLMTALEAIFLSLFILMSTNRANRQADQRAHLDLQVNLLAENEMTKVLLMLQALCRIHGLKEAEDPELQELRKQTEPEAMIRDLNEALPNEE